MMKIAPSTSITKKGRIDKAVDDIRSEKAFSLSYDHEEIVIPSFPCASIIFLISLESLLLEEKT